MTETQWSSAQVVGVRVDAINTEQLVELILSWTGQRSTVKVAVGVNAHVCNMAATDSKFRSLVQSADLNYADGQSVVWAGKLLGHRVPERIATTDLVFPLVAECAKAGKRVFLYGGRPGIAEAAADHLRGLAPGLECRTSDGYVTLEKMPELIAGINEFETDLLLVGLGDPLQQRWIDNHRASLRAPAVLTCGGLFDWTSGRNRRAPTWMIKAGLEWFWRLILEPRRLARRYLIGNPLFIARLTRQILMQRWSSRNNRG